MCGLVNGSVIKSKTGGVPALTDLWVQVGSAAEVSIDALEDSRVDLAVVGLESVVEDNLQVRVVTEIFREVGGRGTATEFDILQRELGRLIRLYGVEILVYRG